MAQQPRRYYLYWDHENCPTPKKSCLDNVIDIVKDKVSNELKIDSFDYHSIKFYNNNGKNKLSPKITKQLDQLSYFKCPTVNNTKNESVDKKIIADIGFDLWDCKGSNDIVIILISGDSDYAWLASKIKAKISTATTILIPRFRPNKRVDPTLKNCFDHVIDNQSLYVDKNKYALTVCPTNALGASKQHRETCPYYHKKGITYKQLLNKKLDISDQSSIIFLTEQAKIDLDFDTSLAEGDCKSIVKHFEEMEKSKTLAVIYLIDSICRKVGGVFIELFAKDILNIIKISYKAINEKKELDKILQIWNQNEIFDANLLNQITDAISEVNDVDDVDDEKDVNGSGHTQNNNDVDDVDDENNNDTNDGNYDSCISSSSSKNARFVCPKCKSKSYKKKGAWYDKHVDKCKG
eukprot:16849_1